MNYYLNPHIGHQLVQVQQPQPQQQPQYQYPPPQPQYVQQPQLFTNQFGQIVNAQGQLVQQFPQQQPQMIQQPAQIMPTYGNMAAPMARPPIITPQQTYMSPPPMEINNRFAESPVQLAAKAAQEASQVVPEQQPAQAVTKVIMSYNPNSSSSTIDLQGTKADISEKLEPQDIVEYVIELKPDYVSNLETAEETSLEYMCCLEKKVYTGVYIIGSEYYGIDYRNTLVEILTGSDITKIASELNHRYKKAKNVDEIVILNALNESITDVFNDILFINYPGILSIQSFRIDYNELMSIIHRGEPDPEKQVISKEISNALCKYLLNVESLCESVSTSVPDYVDGKPTCSKTYVNTVVSVTAISAMAKQARIEHIPMNTILIVNDDTENKYITSVLKTIKQRFISAPASEHIAQHCNLHYLVTLDKRLFKLFWSIDGRSTYICRIQ